MTVADVRSLPLHPTMPKPTPSSNVPPSLTSVPAVEAYIANTRFAGRSVTYLTGGNINYLYRIHLLVPFEGKQTVILKHAQSVVKNWEGTVWDLKRQMFEVAAMSHVRSCLPPSSIVTVPKIHHFDPQSHVVIMEDCGGPNVVTLNEYLSNPDPLTSSRTTDTAKTIGMALGEFLATVHEWSRSNPEGILDLFDKNTQAKETAAEFYYDRVVATLDRADKDWDDLSPLLGDLQLDQAHVQLTSTLTREYRSKLFSDRVSGRDVLVMGDFWHENVLVDVHSPTLRLFVLDWEAARTGLPGFDVGLFCGCLHFFRFSTSTSTAAELMLRNFIESYSYNANSSSDLVRDASLAQDTLFHWGSYNVFWAPRIPPGDKRVVQSLVKEGLDFLTQSRDVAFLAVSPVKRLLPSEC